MKSCQNSDCQNYGVQVDDTAVFCEKCGSRLAVSNEQPKPVTSREQQKSAASGGLPMPVTSDNEPLQTSFCRCYSFIIADAVYNLNPKNSVPKYGKLSVYSDRIEFEIDTEKHKSVKDPLIVIRLTEMVSIIRHGLEKSIYIGISAGDKYNTKKQITYRFIMQSINEAADIGNLIKRLK